MIFFIDTTSKNTRLAFGGQAIDFTAEKQSVELPLRAKEMLAGWERPTAVGVMTGPGSFTGIRLGIAYAKGLAMGYGIPLIGINLFDFSNAQIAAAHSGRGDFYIRRGDEFEIADSLPDGAVLVDRYDPADAISIVQKKLDSDKTEEVIPLYIRPSYAE